MMTSPLRQFQAGLQYAMFRTGPLTISAGQVGIFTKTRPDLATPDIQFHFIAFSSDRPAEGLHKFPGFTQNVCQLRPESRGEILLKSADPIRGAGDPSELSRPPNSTGARSSMA